MNAHPKKPMDSVHWYTMRHFRHKNVSQDTKKHVQNGNQNTGTQKMKNTEK
jgi:hypothetical protein